MFHTKIRVNFYDCDPAGIIFYANIFKMAHTAYEQLFEKISPDRNIFFDEEIVLPITHSEANYFMPLKTGQITDVSVTVPVIKESSFELNYLFEVNGDKHAEVKTVHVCVNKTSFMKNALPHIIQKGLKGESE